MAEVSPKENGPQQNTLKKVLLADDNDRYAKALTEDLLERGVGEVVRAMNAQEAVEILRNDGDGIDGVVSDISMESQISGLRVLRAARKGGNRRVLAVATTGLDTKIGYFFNYFILGILYRSDYLIPKRPIKRDGIINWIRVK